MLFAYRNRSKSIRRWVPRNITVHGEWPFCYSLLVSKARIGSAAAVLRRVAKGSIMTAPIVS